MSIGGSTFVEGASLSPGCTQGITSRTQARLQELCHCDRQCSCPHMPHDVGPAGVGLGGLKLGRAPVGGPHGGVKGCPVSIHLLDQTVSNLAQGPPFVVSLLELITANGRF